jgi:hypothetical protein
VNELFVWNPMISFSEKAEYMNKQAPTFSFVSDVDLLNICGAFFQLGSLTLDMK